MKDEEAAVGFDGRIVKGYVRIDPHNQRAAHAAILALDGAPSQSGTPLGYPSDPSEVMRRATVNLPQRCLESEDVWEAIAAWGSFYLETVPDYVPRDMHFDTNAKGEAYNFRDEWRRINRDADLWFALAPYIRRATIRYEGDDNTKWCYQTEQDGRIWKWAARPWRKIRPLEMEELRRPRPVNLGPTRVVEITTEGRREYTIDLSDEAQLARTAGR